MLKLTHTVTLALLVAALMVFGAANASAAKLQTRNFKIVGSWGNLNNYQKHEKPFWKTVLPKQSGGKITGDISAITELGLKGWEVMRLMKLGVFDVAFGVFGYVASEHPIFEGVDLSSAAKDFKQSRINANAYRKVLEREFRKIFNAKLLVIYRYPSQYMWCNKSISSLADMKGLKIRVYSTTLGDFSEGVGGTSVTVSFAEVVPALQKGVVDCGITGTMPAYKAKWHEVATHVLKINVGAGMAFMAMNLKTWNKLDGNTQKFILKESAALEERMWKGAEEDDNLGLICNTGGPCSIGKAGKMKLVLPSPADFKVRERVLQDFVLKRWAKRCGEKCTKEWNDTIGKKIGMMAKS